MSNKGLMCIQKSFNGRRHDKNIRRGDKSDENVIGDDDVKMYYCHICNVYVPNKANVQKTTKMDGDIVINHAS